MYHSTDTYNITFLQWFHFFNILKHNTSTLYHGRQFGCENDTKNTDMRNYTNFVSFVTYFLSKFIGLGHQQRYLRNNSPVGTPDKELGGNNFFKGYTLQLK